MQRESERPLSMERMFRQLILAFVSQDIYSK